MFTRRSPRDEELFALLRTISQTVASGAGSVEQLLSGLPASLALVDDVADLERRGDELTRAMSKRLQESRGVPFDRGAVAKVVDKMDDVLDALRHAASLVRLHSVEQPIDGVTGLAGLVTTAAARLADLVDRLPGTEDLRPIAQEVSALEGRGDLLYRELVTRLLSGAYEALEVLRWRDIVEDLEKALNRIERSALLAAALRPGSA